MCRLYGFHSTAARKVECELVDAQNALIKQSRRDTLGESNAHGWGLTIYTDGKPATRKQPDPAFEDEDFRHSAADAYSTHVLAHIRRATHGKVSMRNTHPFTHDRWTLAHNGNIGNFETVRPVLLEMMGKSAADRIEGDTDSEHVFHLLLSRQNAAPDEAFESILARTVTDIRDVARDNDPKAEVALNLIVTDGQRTWATRMGRTLWYVHRSHVHRCEVCGEEHAEVQPGDDYRAVDIASERITDTEEWLEIPEGHLLVVDESVHVDVSPLSNMLSSGASAR